MPDDSLDRLGPTRRPDEAAYGYQSWRSLLFLHWEVPVDAVRPLVPAELELDLYDNKLLVGVVPFMMENIRPWRWWPKAFAFRFLETNVRTYVHYRGRPGVYFFSLDAASRLAVRGARIGWSLPYHDASMRMQREGDEVEYHLVRSRNAAQLDVRYRIGESIAPSAPGSLEFFLLERYLLFVRHRGHLLTGQVHHVPYPVRNVEIMSLHENLFSPIQLPTTTSAPWCAHFSDGVDVDIFRLKRM